MACKISKDPSEQSALELDKFLILEILVKYDKSWTTSVPRCVSAIRKLAAPSVAHCWHETR